MDETPALQEFRAFQKRESAQERGSDLSTGLTPEGISPAEKHLDRNIEIPDRQNQEEMKATSARGGLVDADWLSGFFKVQRIRSVGFLR